MLKPEFAEFKTKDGLSLPGLLYAAKNSKKAAIYLHGNGSTSVFYNEYKNKVLAEALNKRGISALFFNNRGAHIIKKINVIKRGTKHRQMFGMAYEKIKECVFDIDGAIGFLRKQGYKEFYLIGSSTGANKICVYNYYMPKNLVSKYVLLAPGDDTGIYYNQLGKKRFWEILGKAKRKIRNKKGDEIIPELLAFGLIFSYKGFYDIANPDGDYNVFPFLEAMKNLKLSKKRLFRHFKAIKKPAFVVFGKEDEYAWGDALKCVEIMKSYQPKLDYCVISGADHGFHGREKEMAEMVAGWLGD